MIRSQARPTGARRAIALPRAGVRVALVAALDGAQGVEGLHDRDAGRPAAPRRAARPRHPEVGVHHVGRAGSPSAGQPAAELRHVRQQFVLGHRRRRPGRHSAPLPRPGRAARAGRHVGSSRRVYTVTSCPRRERRGERGHVDVLAARVDPAECGQRAGMLGHHRDSHARHLLQQPVPVGQEPFEAVPGAARPRGRPAPAAGGRRVGRRSDRRRRVPGRSTSVEIAPASGGTARGRLGGGQRHHRHAQVHGLDQGQAQRRPAERVQVDPAAGQLGVHAGPGAGPRSAAAVRAQPGRAASPVDPMPNTSSGAACAKPGSRSVPVVPAAPHRLVDDHRGPRQLAGPALARGPRCRARSPWSGAVPQSQNSSLKWVTCTRGMSSPVGQRVAGLRHVAAWARRAPGTPRAGPGPGGGRASGGPAQSPRGPLQDHHVDCRRRAAGPA